MSGKVFKIVAFFLLLLTQLDVMGQNDSIKVEYTVENTDKSDYKFKERYKYLQRRMIEEKSLFKVSLLDLTLAVTDQTQYLSYHSRGTVLMYERKISPSFSFLYQNLLYFQVIFPNNQPLIDNPKFKTHILNLSTIGGRYYYDQARRIRNGKSANNFSANYLSLQFDNILQVRNNYSDEDFDKVDRSATKPSVNLLYGIQRRLGKLGYTDLNLGVRYDEINYNEPLPPDRKSNFGIIANFSIGFGF
jgi:hypothetical protein